MLTEQQAGILMAFILFAVVAVLIRILLRKEKITKEYQIPPNFVRIQFTGANMRLPVGSNLGKQIIIIENGRTTKLPFHPIVANMYAHYKGLPYIDETLGQDTLPQQIIGEIPSELPPTKVEK